MPRVQAVLLTAGGGEGSSSPPRACAGCSSSRSTEGPPMTGRPSMRRRLEVAVALNTGGGACSRRSQPWLAERMRRRCSCQARAVPCERSKTRGVRRPAAMLRRPA
ncbi:hypothetical protein SEVIR_7G069800v4 [Setaria viridis]|uniref:Uncharacterized protein n=1 Tax=Setaria viridis TaxID=4556 RepID=A0A4U6TS15_SETVI|nr:hypothetical protein SEVIR_7G069800v2 [Setaria viridis]